MGYVCFAVPPLQPWGSLGTGGVSILPPVWGFLWRNGALICARAHPHPQFPFLPPPLSNSLDFKCHSQAAQVFGNNLPGVGGPSTAPSCSNVNLFASSGCSSPSHIPLIASFLCHTSIPSVACAGRKCHEIPYLILEVSLGQLKLLLIIGGV